MTAPLDPIKQRQHVREVGTQLDALADEYWSDTGRIRDALNRLLGAGPDEWLELLYAAGPLLPESVRAGAHYDREAPPSPLSPNRVLARFYLEDLARRAAQRDRAGYYERVSTLKLEPGVAAEAERLRSQLAAWLYGRSLNEARNRTVSRAGEVLKSVGLGFGCDLRDNLQRARCSVSAKTWAVLLHWQSHDDAPARLTNGRLTEPGEGYEPLLPCSEDPTDSPPSTEALVALLSESDRKRLDWVGAALADLPRHVTMIREHRDSAAEWNHRTDEHAQAALITLGFARNLKSRFELLDHELNRHIRIESPGWVSSPKVADLLKTNHWQASELTPAAEELIKACEAFVKAAARHRGIPVPGTTLTEDVILELEATVRPRTAPANEGAYGSARKGGRRRFTESKKPEEQAKRNVYELIRAAKEDQPRWGKKQLHEHFKDKKDFLQLVRQARLTYEVDLFHKALVWIKANPAGQKSRSGNVS